MRSRIIAIIVLILFVGVPSYLYWYFYKKNIASIIFLSEGKESFTISLDGKLEYQYFPLLDQVFHYKSTCTSSCIFTPIPPLIYDLRISTAGREDKVDTISLESGESVKYRVEFPKTVFFEKIASMPHAIPPTNIESLTPIGISARGKVIAIENKREGGNVGVINNGKFVGLFRSPASVSGSYLDESREFLVVPNSRGNQELYGITGTEPGITFPFLDTIIMVTNDRNIWKVRTQDALYEYMDGDWKKNVRFSDYIDLSEQYRLGYISQTQGEKLRLQNYPNDASIILLLDRISNEVTLVKKDVDILGFFSYEGVPAYLHTDGTIHSIILKGYE